MMRQPKNTILKLGSLDTMLIENWFLVPIAQISNLETYKLDVGIRKLMYYIQYSDQIKKIRPHVKWNPLCHSKNTLLHLRKLSNRRRSESSRSSPATRRH